MMKLVKKIVILVSAGITFLSSLSYAEQTTNATCLWLQDVYKTINEYLEKIDKIWKIDVEKIEQLSKYKRIANMKWDVDVNRFGDLCNEYGFRCIYNLYTKELIVTDTVKYFNNPIRGAQFIYSRSGYLYVTNFYPYGISSTIGAPFSLKDSKLRNKLKINFENPVGTSSEKITKPLDEMTTRELMRLASSLKGIENFVSIEFTMENGICHHQVKDESLYYVHQKIEKMGEKKSFMRSLGSWINKVTQQYNNFKRLESYDEVKKAVENALSVENLEYIVRVVRGDENVINDFTEKYLSKYLK